MDAPVTDGAQAALTPRATPVVAVRGVPLATKDVAVSVGARQLVSGLTVSFAPGEFVAVLGAEWVWEDAHASYAGWVAEACRWDGVA